MGFDWKATLAAVAPAIGSAIGGPFGALAGTAVKAVLGLDEDSTEESTAQALAKATPEQLLALKQADNEFKLNMQKLGIDLAKIDADDRNSARARETNVKDAMPKLLALVIIAGFFATVAYVLGWGLKNMDAASAAFAGSLVGYVSAKAEQVVAYYFGSSAGSSKKDLLLFSSTPAGK